MDSSAPSSSSSSSSPSPSPSSYSASSAAVAAAAAAAAHHHHHHHHHLHHNLHDTNAFSRPPTHLTSAPSSTPSRLASWAAHSHTHSQWPLHPSDMVPPFTAEMRDRQARGKDPYLPETLHPAAIAHRTGRSAPLDMASISMARIPPAKQSKEPFQKTERRDWAETVLDNPELLMMYAHSSGDTLPVTRLRFKKIMCGFDDYDDDDLSIPDLSHPGAGGGYYSQGHPQQRFNAASNMAQHPLGRKGSGLPRGPRP